MKAPAAPALALVLLAGFAWRAAPAGAAPAHPARLFDDSRDTIVRGAFVPSEDQQQGEVRLIRRDGAVVMQTVLYTRILKRVVGEIRKKELAAWPPDREGHADALRYVAAVRDARERIHARSAGRAGRGRQAMLIEFILSGEASLVAISEPGLEEANGHMRVVSRRPIAVLDLSRSYVRGDIYEIARDALQLGKAESRRILEPLLPPEPGAGGRPPGEEGRQGSGR